MTVTIRQCTDAHLDEIQTVINDAAVAYRGRIPADRWHEPYMSADELRREVRHGVVFWGAFDGNDLAGVMGLQLIEDVALIRHAYTRTAAQSAGIGSALLARVRSQTDRPMLIGTWSAAEWAIRFYERHGFQLVTAEKDRLLRRYWNIPDRQIEESVVLADERWRAMR